jgi:hypothetical protein
MHIFFGGSLKRPITDNGRLCTTALYFFSHNAKKPCTTPRALFLMNLFSLSTALFSFLYHLSSYDNGAEALVISGMVESLLKVIRLIGDQQDQIMFVTRAVRIVDLVTNVDMQSFQTLKGNLSASKYL